MENFVLIFFVLGTIFHSFVTLYFSIEKKTIQKKKLTLYNTNTTINNSLMSVSSSAESMLDRIKKNKIQITNLSHTPTLLLPELTQTYITILKSNEIINNHFYWKLINNNELHFSAENLHLKSVIQQVIHNNKLEKIVSKALINIPNNIYVTVDVNNLKIVLENLIKFNLDPHLKPQELYIEGAYQNKKHYKISIKKIKSSLQHEKLQQQ